MNFRPVTRGISFAEEIFGFAIIRRSSSLKGSRATEGSFEKQRNAGVCIVQAGHALDLNLAPV